MNAGFQPSTTVLYVPTVSKESQPRKNKLRTSSSFAQWIVRCARCIFSLRSWMCSSPECGLFLFSILHGAVRFALPPKHTLLFCLRIKTFHGFARFAFQEGPTCVHVFSSTFIFNLGKVSFGPSQPSSRYTQSRAGEGTTAYGSMDRTNMLARSMKCRRR